MLASLSANRTNPWAFGGAAAVNGALLLLLLCLQLRAFPPHVAVAPHPLVQLDDLPLLIARGAPGGSGGGTNSATEAMRGRPPVKTAIPLAPPQMPVLDRPRLAIENAMPQRVQLPDDPSLTNLGVLRSANTTVVSGGTGGPAGIGEGSGNRYGNGRDSGVGPSDGDGIYTAGVGGVSAPVPISTPEAEFSDEARRLKQQGVCLISVIVDTHGMPQNPRVVRALGMGLDEKALEAVRRYRFRPALKNGRPVAARMTVAVDFRLF